MILNLYELASILFNFAEPWFASWKSQWLNEGERDRVVQSLMGRDDQDDVSVRYKTKDSKAMSSNCVKNNNPDNCANKTNTELQLL